MQLYLFQKEVSLSFCLSMPNAHVQPNEHKLHADLGLSKVPVHSAGVRVVEAGKVPNFLCSTWVGQVVRW